MAAGRRQRQRPKTETEGGVGHYARLCGGCLGTTAPSEQLVRASVCGVRTCVLHTDGV